MDNQVLMFDKLEMDNPEAAKKVAESQNCLQEMFLDLLNERELDLATVQRETQIPWGTLYGWYVGDVKTQKADKNLLKLAKFFNVSLHYLCFGIGDDEPVFEVEKAANQ